MNSNSITIYPLPEIFYSDPETGIVIEYIVSDMYSAFHKMTMLKKNWTSFPRALMLFLVVLSGCATQGYRDAKVRVADDILIKPEQVMSVLPPASSGSDVSLEFIVTDFSGGAETIRITESGITEGTRDGHIRILVMVRVDNTLKKTFVIECKGRDRDDIMLNLKKIFEERFAVKKQW